jgi:hypothetical protein
MGVCVVKDFENIVFFDPGFDEGEGEEFVLVVFDISDHRHDHLQSIYFLLQGIRVENIHGHFKIEHLDQLVPLFLAHVPLHQFLETGGNGVDV